MNLMYVAVAAGILALLFALFLAGRVNKVAPGNDRMVEISSAIAEGARAFLFAEYRILIIFAVVLFILILVLRGLPRAVKAKLRPRRSVAE